MIILCYLIQLIILDQSQCIKLISQLISLVRILAPKSAHERLNLFKATLWRRNKVAQLIDFFINLYFKKLEKKY